MRLPKLDQLRTWHVDAIGLSAILALTAAAWFLHLQPTFDGRHDRATYAAQLAAESAKRREIDQSLKTSAEDLKAVLTFIRDNKVDLQPTTAANEHLARLTDLATRCGLQVDTVEPGKEEPGPHYTTVSIRLTGHATAKDFAGFLSQLRQNQPDHGVIDLSLSGQPSTTETPATFTLTLAWYAAPRNAVALPFP